MTTDKVNFARFVFFFHWLASGLSLLSIWFAWRLGAATSDSRNVALLVTVAFALLVWRASHEDMWDLKDAPWYGALVVWSDAVLYVSLSALVYFGVDTLKFFYGIGGIAILGVCALPLLAAAATQR